MKKVMFMLGGSGAVDEKVRSGIRVEASKFARSVVPLFTGERATNTVMQPTTKTESTT